MCVERSEGIPKRVWVRIKTRVKCYPLEKLRLATCDEMVSAEYITGALKDVQEELNKGALKVVEAKPEEMPAIPEERVSDPPDARMKGQESSSSSEASSAATAEDVRMEREAKRKELLSDVPQAMRKQRTQEPHSLSFQNKKALFEKLAKEFQAPTKMEEAKLRVKMENAFEQLKKVRKSYRKEDKDKSRASSAAGSARRTRPAYLVLPEPLEKEIDQAGGLEFVERD